MALPEHPNIAQCHFVREVDQMPAVFTEFVAGGDLATWRPRGRIHGARSRQLLLLLREPPLTLTSALLPTKRRRHRQVIRRVPRIRQRDAPFHDFTPPPLVQRLDDRRQR